MYEVLIESEIYESLHSITYFITFLLKKKHFVAMLYTFIPNYCLSCSCHSTKEFVSLIWKIKCLANSKSMFNNTYTNKRVTQRIQTYNNNPNCRFFISTFFFLHFRYLVIFLIPFRK